MAKGAKSAKVNVELSKSSSGESTESMMQMKGDWMNEMEQWSIEDRSRAPLSQNLSTNNSVESKTSVFLLTAASFSPNLLGIKGLTRTSVNGYIESRLPSGTIRKRIAMRLSAVSRACPKIKVICPRLLTVFPGKDSRRLASEL